MGFRLFRRWPVLRATVLVLLAAVILAPGQGVAKSGDSGPCQRNYLTDDDLRPSARWQTQMQRPQDLEVYYPSAASTDVYVLHSQEYRWQPVPGVCITRWGFEGTTPGPTLRVSPHRKVEVMQFNQLPGNIYNPYFDPNNAEVRLSPTSVKYSLYGPTPTPPPAPYNQRPYALNMYELDPQTTIHLHGGHQLPKDDGHPMDTFPPGRSKLYEYPNNQEPTTLWYHDHDMDHTRGHVIMGLAGFYVIDEPPAVKQALGLPAGDFDVPVLIQRVPGEWLDTRTPDMPVWTVNNAVFSSFDVVNQAYRFRFLNASDETPLSLYVSDTEDPSTNSRQVYLQPIGTDGGLMNYVAVRQPDYWNTQVRIFPAERSDVIIDFSQVTKPTTFYLQGAAIKAFLPDPTVTTPQPILQFRVTPTVSNPTAFSVPNGILRPDDPITKLRGAVRDRTFTFGFRNVGTPPFATINDRFFDEHRIDAHPQVGTTEVWHLVNTTDGYHPIHIHDIFFQVIERVNQFGQPVEQQPGDWDSGNLAWKDIFVIPPFGRVTIIGRFTDNLGVYVFHCHNLVHEDAGMMSQFEVVESDGPSRHEAQVDAHAAANGGH